MFLVYESSNVTYVKNLDNTDRISVYNDQISDESGVRFFGSYGTQEEALARFNDLVEAMASDQKVYDLRKEVGYWKTKKPGPKPKAKAPAPETPEPKK